MNVMKAVRTGMVKVCIGATSLTSVYAGPMPSAHATPVQNDVVQARDDHRPPPPYAHGIGTTATPTANANPSAAATTVDIGCAAKRSI